MPLRKAHAFPFTMRPDRKSRKVEREGWTAMTGPLAGGLACQCQRGPQLWTVGNNSYRGTLLKKKKGAALSRSGRPPKVYRAEGHGAPG